MLKNQRKVRYRTFQLSLVRRRDFRSKDDDQALWAYFTHEQSPDPVTGVSLDNVLNVEEANHCIEEEAGEEAQFSFRPFVCRVHAKVQRGFQKRRVYFSGELRHEIPQILLSKLRDSDGTSRRTCLQKRQRSLQHR